MQKFMRNLKILLIILCVLLGSMPNRTVYAQEEEGEGVAEAAQGEDLPQDDDTVVIEADNDETDETGGTADSTDPAFVSDCSEDTDTQEDADTVTDTKTREESSTVKASENELTISSDFALNADGTYIMADAEQKHVYVSYTVDSPQDKVLVLSIPEYGVNFYESSLPSANDDISEVKLIDPHTFAIRLRNSNSVVELTNTFTLKSVQLTNDQAAYLIDNGMQETKLAVAEYTYSGSLDNILSQAVPDNEAEVWSAKPYFNSQATITATHTYKVAVTPISDTENPLTDYMLYNAGHYYRSHSQLYLSEYKNGEPRFKLPEAYNIDGSLMEIVSIRFYIPDDRLYLKNIGNTETTTSSGTTDSRDLYASDFNQQWGNWTVSEEKIDDNGNKYYEITPTSRWFNINTLNLEAFYGGMVLTWQLEDPDIPLDVNADYVAENTVVVYKLPGSAENEVNDITGPEIKTFDVKYRSISRMWNQNGNANGTYRSWSAGTDAAHDVISGSIHRGEPFVTIFNDSYVKNDGTHYLPAYTGPVTQTYVFPYQIQPLKISISELGQKTYSMTSGKTRLSSFTYTTYEGDVISMTDAEVQAVNSILDQHLNQSTFLTYTFPEDKHVKELNIEWSELATELRWGSAYDEFISLVYSQKFTTKTLFDYKVNNTAGYSDDDLVRDLNGSTWVRVNYSETFDGSITDYSVPAVNGASGSQRAGKKEQQYFWFRIIPELDPYLYGVGRDNDGTVAGWSRLPLEFMNDGIINIGNLGFYVGNYGDRQDYILNPIIDLTVSQYQQSYDKYWSSAGIPRTTLAGITDDQLMAYLTGEFTAMPRLAGWTFEYTTKDHPEGLTYTIEGDIPTDGRAEKLPLEEGDCFVSIRLRYDGYADLSHESETDSSTVIWLMKNIKVKRLSTNPFTGEEISCTVDYSYVGLTLTGNTSWENCVCANHEHDRDITQWMIPPKDSRGNPETPRVLLYSSHKATYKETTNLKTTEIQNIRQGGNTSADFDLVSLFTTVNPLQAAGHYGQDSFASTYYPWGEVNEAVFVEIIDDEFVPDLSSTVFMGYRADSSQVIAEMVTVDGRRFLKLRLADGVVARQTVPHTDRATNTGTITDILTVGLRSLPGTTLGDHHPIGDIYYDASLLLEHYDAPNKTGFDSDRTKYVFDSTAVEDPYGFSNTDVTGAKLFKGDGSAFTVHVDISIQAGVDLAPGKNEVTYDFGDPNDPSVIRTITYYPSEEDSLNALITFKGPGNEASVPLYDMEAYVIIPRIGTDIVWTDADSNEVTRHNTELDLYMRSEAKVISNAGGLEVTITYTTQDSVLQDEMTDYIYVPASEINDWSKVTGLKAHIAQVEPQQAVNIRLDLRSDAKENTDVITAYSGGLYRYRQEKDGPFSNEGTLQLCAWKYENIVIKNGGTGSVFWDWYDENGVKDSNNSRESYIKDVKLSLYDSDGTLIDSAVTNSSGAFTLVTYKTDAGQYIVIENPSVTDGATVKLTKKSASAAINSNTDSDFDRDTNKLVLGTLNANGLSNISAGFIKLPKIVKPSDVVMNANDTFDMTVLVNEYVSNTNYNTSNVLLSKYTIGFDGYDSSLVSLSDTSLAKQSNSQLKAPLTITAADSYGTTTVTITVKNALGDEVTETFTITVNKLILHTEDYEGVYDGEAHKGVAYVTLNGGDILTDATYEYMVEDSADTGNGRRALTKADEWTTTEPSTTDVLDSCTVKVKASHPTYGTVEGSYKITITPAPLSIVTSSEEKVYDGDPLTGTAEITGLVGDENVTLTATGSQTEVGLSENTYSLVFDGSAKESNYFVESEDIGTLTVKPRPVPDDPSAPYVIPKTGIDSSRMSYLSLLAGLCLLYMIRREDE